METADPDDVMALCLLATHPLSNLTGVTVFPGGTDQVGVVKEILRRLGKEHILVGSSFVDDGKARVSEFHYKWLGKIPSQEADTTAVHALQMSAAAGAFLVTGAALRNVYAAHSANGPWFREWTCQGGFVGDNLVPPEYRLPKFAGRTTCPTYNLNGDVKAALGLLTGDRRRTERTFMVSKNVCHGQFFGLHDIARTPRGVHAGLDLLLDGMTFYCQKHPDGKALHDVVAAVLALHPEAGIWELGLPYREKGEWGFKEDDRLDIDRGEKPETFITIGLNRELFEKALVC